jgi:hypothetical protein
MSIRDVLDSMPYRLRNRFESLGSYIQGCIERSVAELERDIEREVVVRDGDQIRRPGNPILQVPSFEAQQAIQMMSFAVAVSRFFRDGTRAASLATSTIESLGTPGFSVGSTVFEGENENVRRGEELHLSLSEAMEDERFEDLVVSQTPLGRIVRDLVRSASNA